ncbi:MAG: response regulator [Elusimicrobia bacterium]|nr:response regulator [Elusimicrobiota bacterium]
MRITTAQKAFTTFEVGRICGVFHTTVINWVNKGKLKAHLTPGGHRPILLDDLIEFMRRFEMPIPPDLISRNKNILVVDDDPSVQRMLVRSLHGLEGLDVRTCGSGLEALMSIGKEAPDLLVLDVQIPQVNGLEVCRLLKSCDQTQPIKIIAVTGERLSQDEEKFLKQNADYFFRKPLSTVEYKRKVIELLELDLPGGASS